MYIVHSSYPRYDTIYETVNTHPKKTMTVIKITNRLKNADTSRTNGTFGFARHTSRPFAKPKEPFQPKIIQELAIVNDLLIHRLNIHY